MGFLVLAAAQALASGAQTVPAVDGGKAPAYKDRLIDDAQGKVDEAGESGAAIDDSPGRRSIAISTQGQYGLPARGPANVAGGVNVFSQFDTLNYGEVRIDAARAMGGGPYPGTAGAGSMLTVFHSGLALSERWQADSAFGVIRAPADYFIGSGARFGVPPLTFEGVQTAVSSPEQQLHFAAGKLGRVGGSLVQEFSLTGGGLATAGFHRRLQENWQAGLQLLDMHGLPAARDERAVAGALAYALPPERQEGLTRAKLHFVTGTGGARGLWGDGEWIGEALAQRFGAYRFDPGLRWGNAPMASDMQGAYWRGDFRRAAYSMSGGLDISQNNIARDPLLGGAMSRIAFGSASRRISRTLSLGGAMELRHDTPVAGTAVASDAGRLTGFAVRQSAWGSARFDVFASGRRGAGINADRMSGLGWSHDWILTGGVNLNTALSLQQQIRGGIRTQTMTAGLAGRRALSDRLAMDGSAILLETRTQDVATPELGLSTQFLYHLARDWILTTRLAARQPIRQAAGRDVKLTFMLLYEMSSGVPYERIYGARGGTGSIEGTVFFDENGDGLRQASERAAPNVTVYLDGRGAVTTDAEGRFNFVALPPGAHMLLLRPEALPLPWTIEPGSRSVQVPVRDAARIDIPLARIPG